MYHSSQNRLEYLTSHTPSYTSSTQPFYSIVAIPTYSDRMFIPAQERISYSSSTLIHSPALHPYSHTRAGYHFTVPTPEYHFVPDNFLKPGKEGIFVGKAEEVKEFVEEAFETIFAQPFPNHIKMSILDREKFQKIAPSSNTIGLSLNRSKEGLLSEIFILNDSLGRVMLTIGHELGHVLTPALQNAHDEEAKAYAFSLVWMKIIKEHNIANLGDAIITEHPAENGLHNIAFRFVSKLLAAGKEEWETYTELINGFISVPHLQNL
ncbi:MAG TPA: hypothetical protein VJA18_06250 [Candidatus Nanoarchaeia archaeon]|nr:hypothetical protein [Candidatus Nanoarchaeia archaeon]